ncbi:MAG: sulfite exporter TauE/SafE family protein [Myxococcales bacterium]|nr:sulfite exporter TauE/SafE family protein [Myxococcales bacterium]
MTTLLLSVLGASLLGSLHCAGMCGPFVAFYAGAGGASGSTSASRRGAAHALYNGGRLLTYVVLGVLAGSLGAGIDRAGTLVSLSRLAALVAGVVMIAWGISRLLELLGVNLQRFAVLRVPWVSRVVAALRSGLAQRSPAARALILGVSSGLLPCGFLWAFVVTAAGTGSPLSGAAVMLAFWLGTVPVLLGLGVGAARLARWLGRAVPALTACALVVVGVLALAGRLGVATPHGVSGGGGGGGVHSCCHGKAAAAKKR